VVRVTDAVVESSGEGIEWLSKLASQDMFSDAILTQPRSSMEGRERD